MRYVLITFESTHEAIKIEKALRDLDVEMIPTPRQLSASCGLSLKTYVEDLENIQVILGESYNKNNQVYLVEFKDKILTFKKV